MALNRLRGLPYFEQKPFIQQAAALASKIKPLNDRNQEEEQQVILIHLQEYPLRLSKL